MFAHSFLCELPQLNKTVFSGTEFWQIAENIARLATVENKLQIFRWCIAESYVRWAYIHAMDADPSPV
jgi:hypothetical protein